MRTGGEKDRYYVLLAIGADAYRFAVTPEVYGFCSSCSIGDILTLGGVRANAFNGRVYYSASSVEAKEV